MNYMGANDGVACFLDRGVFLKKILFSLVWVPCAFSVATFSLREASERDLPALAAAHYVAWHATYDAILCHEYCLKNTPARLERYWKKFFDKQKKDTRFALVAIEDEKIIGFIAAGPSKYLPDEVSVVPFRPQSAEIYKLYVDPRKQGIGVGAQLIQKCFERLMVEKYTEVIVRVFEQNKKASAFYEHCGGVLLHQDSIVTDPLLPYRVYLFMLGGLLFLEKSEKF